MKLHRWIRVEVTLRRPELKRLASVVEWTPNNLNKVFGLYTAKLREMYLQWRPNHAGIVPSRLPVDLHAAWYCWLGGANLRNLPEFATRYNALSVQMRKYGIDIKAPQLSLFHTGLIQPAQVPIPAQVSSATLG